LLRASFRELQPLFAEAVHADKQRSEDDAERGVVAQGLAKAAEILASEFTLVATNVPYLSRGNQDATLRDYCFGAHREAKADLATCFIERCLDFCGTDQGGTIALVTPQNWLAQDAYAAFRGSCLRKRTWLLAAQLGPGAFREISGE